MVLRELTGDALVKVFACAKVEAPIFQFGDILFRNFIVVNVGDVGEDAEREVAREPPSEDAWGLRNIIIMRLEVGTQVTSIEAVEENVHFHEIYLFAYFGLARVESFLTSLVLSALATWTVMPKTL